MNHKEKSKEQAYEQNKDKGKNDHTNSFSKITSDFNCATPLCKTMLKTNTFIIPSIKDQDTHYYSKYPHYVNHSPFPAFCLDDAQIKVLEDPGTFYKQLTRLFISAKERIVLTSLYIGTGDLERDLLEAIRSSCLRAATNRNDDQSECNNENTRQQQFLSDDSGSCSTESTHATNSFNDEILQSTTPSSSSPSDAANSTFSPPKPRRFRVDIILDAARAQRLEKVRLKKKNTQHLSQNNPTCKNYSNINNYTLETHCTTSSRLHDNTATSEEENLTGIGFHRTTITADTKTKRESDKEKDNQKKEEEEESYEFRSSLTMMHDLICLKGDIDKQQQQQQQQSYKLGEPDEQPNTAVLSPDIRIGLFHSPLLAGAFYKFLPPRVNEALGVFHTKLFLADNSVIITGANMSETYFTTRQDRYMLIENAKEFADFLQQLVIKLQTLTFKTKLSSSITETPTTTTADVRSSRTVSLYLEKDVPSPISEPESFKQRLSSAIHQFLYSYHVKCQENRYYYPKRKQFRNTMIYVAVQAGFASPPVCYEQIMLSQILLNNSAINDNPHYYNANKSKRKNDSMLDFYLSRKIKVLINGLVNTWTLNHHVTSSLIYVSDLLTKSKSALTRCGTSTLKRIVQCCYHTIAGSVSSQQRPSEEYYCSKEKKSEASLDFILQQYDDPSSGTRNEDNMQDNNRGSNSGNIGSTAHLNRSTKCTRKYVMYGNQNQTTSQLKKRKIKKCIVVSSGEIKCDVDYVAESDSAETSQSISQQVTVPSHSSYREKSTKKKQPQQKRPKSNQLIKGVYGFSSLSPQTERDIRRIVLSSGYLNMSQALLEELIGNSSRFIELFVASPKANSFFESKGLSMYIPAAYAFTQATQLLKLKKLHTDSSFSPETKQSCLSPRLYQYDRENWTFHSKGLWLYPDTQQEGDDDKNQNSLPFGTVIGSSNYGLRAQLRDLDVSFYVETSDPLLKQQLESEVCNMRLHSSLVSDLPQVLSLCPRWLRFCLSWTRLSSLL